MHEFFGSYALALKICDVCNFGTITGSLCEHFYTCQVSRLRIENLDLTGPLTPV